QVKSLYRDVIYSVTEGKLTLIDDQELKWIVTQETVVEVPIYKKTDAKTCRETIEKLMASYDLSDKKRFNILLCVSEAVTNVIKHAGEGKMKVYYVENVLTIVVEDKGSGIELSDIPKTTLLKGYSTKVSLGHGFSLLVNLMDKIRVNTGPKGTTVVMEIQI
ncbi:MAG: ATP-binding protein, partial [Bacilli bacterium]